MLWLYLHFPQLQLDGLLVQDDQLVPTIIVSGRNNMVMQLNASAHKLGVKRGMGLGAASSMSASLNVYEFKASYEQKRLLELAQWLYLDTAEIHLSKPCGLLIKVSNMLSLHTDLAHYWRIIKARLVTQNVQYHFSFGYSPLAAQLLAQSGFNRLCDDRVQLATELGKLPISSLLLSERQTLQLNRVGIHTVQALFGIPLVELGRRFDNELVQYVGRLQGKLHHPVEFYQPPEVFEREITLLYELENLDYLIKPLFKLLKQLEVFLRLRDKLTSSIALVLMQRDIEPLCLTIGCAHGEYRAQKWLDLCQLVLARTQLLAPLQAVALKVDKFCEPQAHSEDLFSERIGTMTRAGLLSMLQAKLGEESVFGIQTTPDARPEYASVRSEPALHAAPAKPPEHTAPLLRPNLLFNEIQPLNDKVILLQGPERISTGWWDGDDIERDYFVAQDRQFRQLWVFRDRQKRWFIHGVFS
ncbi:Y-family DNA polymerase [Pseudoalteromonas umbrosa]|uniref:Y-family DNA polymerase n=1 Tax=Pseudoalteromonas umbrosa TaxID=3048489 RepID=UPI0024C2BA86|nr:DNA polymerase Y family protein [Pseudoalteromonas sp. B95]MDK1287336.1 DNA polymerase Y family protein [Pseudoalteromonas sp. B95]